MATIPTKYELIEYLHAVRDLLSYQAVDIEGYESTSILIKYSNYQREKIMECDKIVRRFKKKYPSDAI